MEWETPSIDQREQQLIEDEQLIGRLRARQMRNLAVLDKAQVATADGARSLSEWTASRLDIGLETARSLVRTMRRLHDRSDLEVDLSSGETTFDRVEALSRLREDVGHALHLDIAGVRREAARQSRTRVDEQSYGATDRYLVMQPSLDDSWWRIWGGLDGPSGAIVDKVLTERADELPDFPDGSKGELSWRRATALVELSLKDDPPPAQVTVFVDANHAAESGGHTGAVLEAGPNVGKEALEAILCDAVTEVTASTGDGVSMQYGRRRRTAPPALSRAVIHRDGNRCAADGCDSRYRLEAHHIVPWSKGGETNPENLIALCWFHHHIVVHERGFEIFRHPEHGRVRFRKPGRTI